MGQFFGINRTICFKELLNFENIFERISSNTLII